MPENGPACKIANPAEGSLFWWVDDTALVEFTGTLHQQIALLDKQLPHRTFHPDNHPSGDSCAARQSTKLYFGHGAR